MKLYVGNLSYDTNEAELRELFAPFGELSSVRIPTDPGSGRSRGFGFVEMPSTEQGRAAIEALNGRQLQGRAIVVNEARPRGDRPEGGPRGGGGGYRGGEGGGGGRPPGGGGGRGPGGGGGGGRGPGGGGGGRDGFGGGRDSYGGGRRGY